jgi:AraC-like DNA-binding protein
MARRIEAVQRRLLETSASLSEIALACGFADQSHLTRVFRAQVGQSPAHWRRMRLS